jgi:hypothetical protein
LGQQGPEEVAAVIRCAARMCGGDLHPDRLGGPYWEPIHSYGVYERTSCRARRMLCSACAQLPPCPHVRGRAPVPAVGLPISILPRVGAASPIWAGVAGASLANEDEEGRKKLMSQPIAHLLDVTTMIAACASVAMLLFDAGGTASAKGGSPSFYLNTFASLQKTHSRFAPVAVRRGCGGRS